MSKCGNYIASGQTGFGSLKYKSIVNLWDYNTKKLIHTFNDLNKKVIQVMFTPDSKFLICIDFDGLFIVWDVQNFDTIYAKKIQTNIAQLKNMPVISASLVYIMIYYGYFNMFIINIFGIYSDND